MSHMSYNRVSTGKRSSCSGKCRGYRLNLRKCSGKCRGYRLNLRKFYVLHLHKRFTFFLRVFDKLKVSYGEAFQVLKKVLRRKCGLRKKNRKGHTDFGVTSYGRNNSFYAEAIADCLEFIKRTSISSMDQVEDQVGHIQKRDT